MIDLDTLVLARGAHKSPEHGMCVMEAAAYFAGEPHSDRPKCVSQVIGAFLRSWNDSLDKETRQRLKPYIPRVIGTATGKRDDEKRAWMATDWLVRECAPAFLRCAGLTEHAETLESLAALTTAKRAEKARPKIAAAWDAAWAAAWDAAGDAPRGAVRDAARDAVRAAAWAAAGAAAWAAAGAAAWDAAWAAAWAAPGAAAKGTLEPTVKQIQQSAFALLDRMITLDRC
jgi:hypothetical protein